MEVWKTSDGEIFYDEDKAQDHEDMLAFYQECFDEFNFTENEIEYFLKTWGKEIFRLMK